jgi:hypothetical protein
VARAGRGIGRAYRKELGHHLLRPTSDVGAQSGEVLDVGLVKGVAQNLDALLAQVQLGVALIVVVG